MDLQYFNNKAFVDALNIFFKNLNIPVNKQTDAPISAQDLLVETYKSNIESFQLIDDVYFYGMVDDAAFKGEKSILLHDVKEDYEGILIFGVTLKQRANNLLPTRSQLAEIARAFNREYFYTPVIVVFKYGEHLAFANTERLKYKQEWREGEKTGKVTLLRDINIYETHSGHERIILELKIATDGINKVDSFAKLYKYWQEVFSVNILNKKFFEELTNWYFWAMDKVQFPDDIEKKKDVRNATNLIRLITRVIFIWFIKEKHLVSSDLFNEVYLDKILKDFNKNKKSVNYYQAILQNLFFGTLNQKMDERDFAEDHDRKNKLDQGIKNKYRYLNKFTISKKEVFELFINVPFLNGGLFDCLDKFDEKKLEEGKKEQIFVDGFTRVDAKQAIIPDYLFFSKTTEVNLTEYYDPEAKKPIIRKVKGLIEILNHFKFTVIENTPIEEEIALDPELLGKVFENLLASYNPETKTTARKQTGSFYTPREIVNYMVEVSLLEYLKQNVKINSADLENRLHILFLYNDKPNPFNDKETNLIIEAINNCKILDPACGSGAFPMGVLHKMVHILQQLDPENIKWKAQQREKIIGEQIRELEKDKKAIQGLNDNAVREKAEKAVEERLKEIDEIFENRNYFDDYARKLYFYYHKIPLEN